MTGRRWCALGTLCLAAAGCFERDVQSLDPVVQTVTSIDFLQTGKAKVDLLLVMDDSGSMHEEQEALAAYLPGLVEELMLPSEPGRRPVDDLRVGVVSTDLGSFGHRLGTCDRGLLGFDAGNDGCLLHDPAPAPGCADSYPRFLTRDPSDALTYPPDQLGRDLGCIATLGTTGCGLERQLEAAHRALTHQSGAGRCNEGFLRPDSIVAVVWVSDEEDCSTTFDPLADPSRSDLGPPNLRCIMNPVRLTPVADLVDGLRGLRGPERVVFAMLVGVPPGTRCEGRGDGIASCLLEPIMEYRIDPADPSNILPACVHPLGWGSAAPGRRFVEAALRMGRSALVRSICNEDWRPAMDGILALIRGAIRSVCFPHHLAYDETACAAGCNVIELLPDDRPCPPGRLEADPPLETDDAGHPHRRCRIAQAERSRGPDGRCGETVSEGWYYLTPEQSPEGCAQVLFTDGALPEPDAAVRVECLNELCPPGADCAGGTLAP